MYIGIPKETKVMEGRVALTPSSVADLVSGGHSVFVETEAGLNAHYLDKQYEDAGAKILSNAKSVYAQSELLVKVKEPISVDLQYMESHHILFCYLHLAANLGLTAQLKSIGLTAIAFETVVVDGRLPLLAPMSEIAGKAAVHLGVEYLQLRNNGRGVMFGGAAGSDRGNVVVIGGGVAGSSAAILASAMGAQVTVYDKSEAALSRLACKNSHIFTKQYCENLVRSDLGSTDLLVGAVLVPGAVAPSVISREMIKGMPASSVCVDISIDQGGCIESSHATTYESPAYVEEGVTHIAVTNLPGTFPRTASQALSGAIEPYVHQIAARELGHNEVLDGAVNIHAGVVVHPAIPQS